MSHSLRPQGLQHLQASLSFTISWSLLKLISIELMMPSNYLILFLLLLLPLVFPKLISLSLLTWKVVQINHVFQGLL